MEGFESTEMEDAEPEFTLKEIIAMERLFKDVGEKSLSQEFCQELVDNFRQSKYRAEKPAIKWEQVQSWFQDKQKQIAAKVCTLPVVAPKEFNSPSDWALTISVPESLRKTKAERVAGLSELAFEAKSFKDFAWLASIVGPTRLLITFKKTSCRGITSDIKKANEKHRLWYDVAAFLNYRVVHTGELEVRVRFSGFSYDQDEWVNVKRGVRERSIPLEPSECHRVKVGDPVLCFRETDVRAIYCDAFILDIQRSTHDTLDCTCQFLVRYTYDNAEATVPLSSVCCRPT